MMATCKIVAMTTAVCSAQMLMANDQQHSSIIW